MILLRFFRRFASAAGPAAVTQGIGRALRELPARVGAAVAVRGTVTASARPAGSMAMRRNTQGSTR